MSRTLFGLTIFVGSFLLFLVQPMLAKALLPIVGGAPAVWIVSMLFFQLLLLAGYGYAAIGSAFLQPRQQLMLHLLLMVIAIAVSLPLSISSPLDYNASAPEWWVLATLLFTVGAPYFLLAANATLLQRWYHARFNATPYFLFSISNLGSLIGLLGYPFVVEWLLALSQQMIMWGSVFALLFACLVTIGLLFIRRPEHESALTHSLGKGLSGKDTLYIIVLGFVPSSLFLGTTLLISTDIASFPMLWVIPLALYLVSFILVFSRSGERATRWAQRLHPVAMFVFIVVSLMFGRVGEYVWVQAFLLLFAFMVVAISCHGRAAMLKPSPEKLTAFYFWLSVGGALGGLFNTIAPYLFNRIVEHHITILLSLLALPLAQFAVRAVHIPKLRLHIPSKIISVIALCGIVVLASYPMFFMDRHDNFMFEDRSFFGVSRIFNDSDEKKMVYRHGSTLHGFQPIVSEHRLSVTSYYRPIKLLANALPSSFSSMPIAVIGLGVGTSACVGAQGQRLDFYEIDPLVIRMAKNADYFSYLRDCSPTITTYLGDGRIELAKQSDATYGLIVMDAFTSDAVPIHLLTQEATQMYLRKMRAPDGILAFHISNRFLDLRHVLARIAVESKVEPLLLEFEPSPNDPYVTKSLWLVMLQPNSAWREVLLAQGFKPILPKAGTPLWTDDYSNLLSVFK